MKHQPITATKDPSTGARYLPPVMYFVVAEYELAPPPLSRPTLGFACDPLPDLDAAADAVGEAMRDRRDRVVAVLRLTDTLNCDDVTADAFDTYRLRLIERRLPEALEEFDAQVEEMARAKPPRDWAPSERFGAIRDYPEFDRPRLSWADIALIGCVSVAGAAAIYAFCLIALALLP